jgi:hypothetical protein
MEGIGNDGAAAVDGMPYGPGYYAAFFTDPSGNRFEVYVRPPDPN